MDETDWAMKRRFALRYNEPEDVPAALARIDAAEAAAKAEAAAVGTFGSPMNRHARRAAASLERTLFKGRSDAERKHLLELNKRCAVSVLGNTTRIIWQPDPAKPPKFLSSKDARELEATRIVEVKTEGGGTKKLKMFNEWFESPDRRAYDEIKFAPGSDDPKIFNLWKGWGVDPSPGDWSLFYEHLRSVLCCGDQVLFDWVLTWLAHLFQRPNEKIPVAVVIQGEKGTGKSFVFENVLRHLMPGYLTKIADGKRALGNFNSSYETTLLLLMEEAFWAGDQAKEAVLKDMITSSTQRIERKGIEPYEAPNYMRVVMISNERWVVPATVDERRYLLLKCGNQHRGDHAYFTAIDEQMKAGGLAAMLHDLLNYKPEDGWGVLFRPPSSVGLQEQIIESFRGLDRFMYDLLSSTMYECDRCDEGGIFLSADEEKAFSLTDVRAAARDYMADNFPGHKQATHNMIEKAVREWFGARVSLRPGHQNNARWVTFPRLAECRDHAARVKNIRIEQCD